MKFLATGQSVLAITLFLATGLLAAPTLESGTETPSVKNGAVGTTEKRASTTTIAGVEVDLNSDNVPILGAGKGVGGKPMDMAVYEAAGKKSYAAYNKAIAAGADSPDTTTTTDVSKIVKNKVFADAFKFSPAVYKAERANELATEVLKSYKELQLFTADQLGSFALSKLKGFMSKVTVTNPNTSTKIILDGIYDKTGYAQIALNAFKANDATPTTNPARLPVNELSWQTWASVATTNTKNLEIFFLTNIQNEGFWQIAANNYAEADIPPTKAAIWEPKDAQNTVWFERLLGSDNINGKMLALTNHHNAIGNKKIAWVVTIPRQAAKELGATGTTATKFTAALVLAS
ncbi:hypothetical protein N0V93_004867 [Gnomoniopsis smithogilvyi]|uniref:Uncharacterized protein n=1 Tax=Gnomoniopsis smithogilvyi TaxID=1191159 RepID=A0A9W9CXH3_9PEZI|nr:hypothetical protein N0V93_004867 [Gnomoniopsis smithogilvyi]